MTELAAVRQNSWCYGETSEGVQVNRRINILYLIDHFQGAGGTERHLAQLVQRLPKDVFNCSIVAFDLCPNNLLESVRAAGIPVTHIPVSREYVPNAILRARDLYKLIRRNRIDIVQTFHQKSDTYGAIIAQLAGVKHLISSKRDTGQLRKPWHFMLNRRLRSLFQEVIVVADAVRDAVVANDHLNPAVVTKIYNGVDLVQFSPPTREQAIEARARFGFTPEDFVIGMVAHYRPEKNHDIFFEGVLKALPHIPSLKVLTLGDGPLLSHFRDYCARTELGSRVVFEGEVPGVVNCLRAMDVGCLVPSSNEGFSNAVLEKMAVGLPVVVTAVGGNAEAVNDQENGFVIPPANADALTRALVAMYSDPRRRLAMGRKGRELAEEKFSLDQMCRRHEQLYLSVCEPA